MKIIIEDNNRIVAIEEKEGCESEHLEDVLHLVREVLLGVGFSIKGSIVVEEETK